MLITPPLFTPRGYCSIFTFFCFINHKHSHFSTAAFRCHYVQFPVVAGLYRRGHPTNRCAKHPPVFVYSRYHISPSLQCCPSRRGGGSWQRSSWNIVPWWFAPHPPHGTVNHFPHHVICVLSHRYNYLRLPLLKYITTRRNSNSHCQTGNRLHNAPNSFSYLGGYSQLMTSRPYTYPCHFRIIT